MSAKAINTKPYIIVGIVLFVVAILIIIYVKFFKKKVIVNPSNDTPADTKRQWSNDEFPLKLGSQGLKVKYLQAGLNIAYNSRLATDGKLGEKTAAVLKENTGADSISEQVYNDIIEPKMTLIKKYLDNISGAGSKPVTENQSVQNATAAPTKIGIDKGDSVEATKTTTGWKVLKNVFSGDYKMANEVYGVFKPREYIGVVLDIQNKWIVCAAANDHAVYVLSADVKITK